MKSKIEIIDKQIEIRDKISELETAIRQQTIPHLRWRHEYKKADLEIEFKLLRWILN